MWLYIVQLAAFRCWSSKTSMDPTSSIVRGRSLKSGLVPRMATTGLATTGSVDWHTAVATNWDLSCSYVTSAGILGRVQQVHCSWRVTQLHASSVWLLGQRRLWCTWLSEWNDVHHVRPRQRTVGKQQAQRQLRTAQRRRILVQGMQLVRRQQCPWSWRWLQMVHNTAADISHVDHVLDHFTWLRIDYHCRTYN